MTDALLTAEVNRLSPATRYYYRIYGILFSSELELPELMDTGAPIGVDADVEIVLKATGPLDPTGEHAVNGICVEGRTAQFLVDGVGRYTIFDGRRILVEPLHSDSREPADGADLRLFLLGSAMGAVLYQRGIIPLHTSAVATPDGSWAFTGLSGAGKSTLASWLSTYWGLALITDDVLAVHPQGDALVFHPGPPRAKLWTDALAALGISSEGLTRDYSRADKYQMSVANLGDGPCPPLRGLVFLERCAEDEAPSLVPVTGVEAFQAIVSALYRPSFAARILPRKVLFEHCMRLARLVPCYRFRRWSSLTDMDKNLAPLLDKMGVAMAKQKETLPE